MLNHTIEYREYVLCDCSKIFKNDNVILITKKEKIKGKVTSMDGKKITVLVDKNSEKNIKLNDIYSIRSVFLNSNATKEGYSRKYNLR